MEKADYVRENLRSLAEHYQRDGIGRVALWEMLAGLLSDAVGKVPRWKRAYIQQVHDGRMPASEDLARAIETLGLEVDGYRNVDALKGRVQVTVFSPPGMVVPGSLVWGESRKCSAVGCNNWFVPNSFFRTKCYVCSPPKYK